MIKHNFSKRNLYSIVLTLFLCISIGLLIKYTDKNSPVIAYTWGSKGSVVIKIQSKLKGWGYYDGAVDGVYGYNTYKAIQHFQANNGLTPDGIAGTRTLDALGLPSGTSTSTTTSNASSSSYEKELNLLAGLINGEARGEPYEGQVAVGATVINRTKDPRFPSTIAGVIYQPGAFTCVVDGQIYSPVEASCLRAARDALNGWDPSGGAIYYFNPNTATSAWIWSRPLIKIIGNHRFCK